MKTILFLTVLLFAQQACAQQLSQKSDEPLQISADGSLEWDRVNHKYLAKGKAIARQGTAQIEADKLTADYRENNGQTEIYHLKAEGNVVLTSDDNKAYGDQADYDVDSGKAILVGKNLRMTGPDMTVTATKSFEYYSKDGRIVAIGSPVITNKGDTLKADQVTAWTAKEEDKKNKSPDSKMGNLKKAEAVGNVVITTPNEQATSDKAVYDGATNTTKLDGNVKLTQDRNTLQGGHAQMDMTTKVSKMQGADGTGRVTGTFYSKKDTPLTPAKTPVAASSATPLVTPAAP